MVCSHSRGKKRRITFKLNLKNHDINNKSVCIRDGERERERERKSRNGTQSTAALEA